MSHMFAETLAIAHHNTYNFKNNKKKLDGNPTMGKFLDPHFTNLIAINGFARVTLVAPFKAVMSGFMGIRGEDFVEVIARWYTWKTNLWETEIGYYEDLKTRGFDPDTFKYRKMYRYLNDG
jgi:hypothetical protein